MISDSILFSFFSTCSTIFNSRSNNIDIDFMYLFLFYRIFIYVSIRAAPRCIIYEPRCIKTQKGRRITPTPSLLSGFIFSYLRYFFFCLYLNIHTSSFTVASRKRIRISFADGRLLLHNIRFLTKYAVP